jgi:hypothetical protein
VGRFPRIIGTIIVFAATANQVSLAQSQADINTALISHWVDSVTNADPAKLNLLHNADSYRRFLEVQAASALKINPSAIWSDPDENNVSAQDVDSGSVHNVSNDPDNFQNETSVVINRKYPNVIVVGANDARMSSDGMPAFYSNDTGRSWHTTFLPTVSGTQALGDPMLAYNLDGSMYYAYLRAEVGLKNDNIMVTTSTDGANWTNGTPVISADSLRGYEDKPHMCVDRSTFSSHNGRVYVVWTHFDSTGYNGTLNIAWSDDKCKTWSAPVVLENELLYFAEVKTGKYGEVVVTASVQNDLSTGAHYLYVSTNGGSIYAKHYIAAFKNYPRNVDHYPSLKGSHGFRCYPYTSFDLNLFTNQLHIVYGTWYTNSSAVLYYVSSSNFGMKWSTPLAIGYGAADPAGFSPRDRFCPWVSVNQLTGEAFVSYYSSERDSANTLISTFRQQLDYDNDKTPRALEAADFDARAVDTARGKLPFIGDYIGSDHFDPVSTSVWTEIDPVSSHGDIFGFVAIARPQSNSVAPTILRSDRLRIASVNPNPASGRTITINCYSPRSSEADLALYDLTGKLVAHLWTGSLDGLSSAEINATLPPLPAGTYIARITAANMTDEAKVVLE